MFRGKYRLVIDSLLNEGHDVVHVLRGGHATLLALVVDPEVIPATGENWDMSTINL